MENQNYMIVQENVVTNIIIWNGDTSQWTPPSDATMLVQSSTPAKVWVADEMLKDYVLQEHLGAGAINFTWDGSVLTTNEPKPEWIEEIAPDQPTTDGIQSL